jgi:hypothetical protein
LRRRMSSGNFGCGGRGGEGGGGGRGSWEGGAGGEVATAGRGVVRSNAELRTVVSRLSPEQVTHHVIFWMVCLLDCWLAE